MFSLSRFPVKLAALRVSLEQIPAQTATTAIIKPVSGELANQAATDN
jgi:hypothetical protein